MVDLYKSPYTGQHVDNALGVVRECLVGNGSGTFTISQGVKTFLSNEIKLDSNSHYIVRGQLWAIYGNTSDSVLAADTSGITREYATIQSEENWAGSDSISLISFGATSTVDPEAGVFVGEISTGTDPTIRFYMNPSNDDVDVARFNVVFEKVTNTYDVS